MKNLFKRIVIGIVILCGLIIIVTVIAVKTNPAPEKYVPKDQRLLTDIKNKLDIEFILVDTIGYNSVNDDTVVNSDKIKSIEYSPAWMFKNQYSADYKDYDTTVCGKLINEIGAYLKAKHKTEYLADGKMYQWKTDSIEVGLVDNPIEDSGGSLTLTLFSNHRFESQKGPKTR